MTPQHNDDTQGEEAVRICHEEYANHQLANKYGSLSFFFALDEAVSCAMHRFRKTTQGDDNG